MTSRTRGIHIRVKLSLISDISNFHHKVLNNIYFFLHENSNIFLVKLGFEFYAKNAVLYKFRIFEKNS